jgi:hypothetical protein
MFAYAQVSGNLKTNTNFAETDQLNNVDAAPHERLPARRTTRR